MIKSIYMVTVLIGMLLSPSGLVRNGHLSEGGIDREQVSRTALDYMEGWFEGDAGRMARCLHPDLTKRGIFFVKETGRSRFGIHSASTLVEGTRLGRGKEYPKKKRNIRVQLLDISGSMASVRITSLLTVEYLHLVKYNGEWKVIHVLWKPVEKPEGK